MMKLPWRLCFLVLAISSLSRGQNVTTPPPEDDQDADITATLDSWTTTTFQTETKNETSSPTSAEETTMISEDTQKTNNSERLDGRKDDKTSDGDQEREKSPDGTTQVSTPAPSTSETTQLPQSKEDSTSGRFLYVILVMIFLLIIILCVILYFLRRINRSYSFDLQRPTPSNYTNEPIGVFEQVYLDDLDRPAPKDTVITDDLSTTPVANGTSLQTEEKVSNGENAAQEQPEANGVQNSPTSATTSSSTDAQAEKITESLSITDLLFDAAEEDKNENNNNNPSVCPGGPFVEINLDEPAWCDQLLTSPQASSSVLPFSPFSFSSSSS